MWIFYSLNCLRPQNPRYFTFDADQRQNYYQFHSNAPSPPYPNDKNQCTITTKTRQTLIYMMKNATFYLHSDISEVHRREFINFIQQYDGKFITKVENASQAATVFIFKHAQSKIFIQVIKTPFFPFLSIFSRDKFHRLIIY